MISKDEVSRLGRLSRIEFTQDDLEMYTNQIEHIVKYIDVLDNIPMEEIQLVGQEMKIEDLREDKEIRFEANVLGTIYQKDGFVRGPKMA